MMQYKNMPGINVYYTDTDSIITDKELPSGKEIGELKDELNGGIILDVMFLGPKKYILKIKEANGNIITKSVFAGVPRNSLT
jgi:hypothetical protein